MSRVEERVGLWTPPSGKPPLFVRHWRLPEARETLLIVHGFGEHGGRYETFARAMADRGISSLCPDLYGHGRTPGRRGELASLDDSVQVLSELAGEQIASGRLSVFGHSFGGLLAILWALRDPSHMRCLAVQSPLLEVGFPIPRWKSALAEALAVVWPNASLGLGLDAAWLSHDPQVADDYRRDPLVHQRMTAGTYARLQHAKGEAMAQATRLRVPTLLLYGLEDTIISIAHCERFAQSLQCPKRVVMFPHARHELHHETIRSDAADAIAQWLEQHA